MRRGRAAENEVPYPTETLRLPAVKPGCRGMLGDVKAHNLAAVMRQDDHDVERSLDRRQGYSGPLPLALNRNALQSSRTRILLLFLMLSQNKSRLTRHQNGND